VEELRKGDWLETYTGRKFWPLDPCCTEVDITDIAHALSMQCRFGGHCKIFYSVAEHSILVSKEIKARGHNYKLQLYGLLHDAAEAYICDLPRPIKRQIGIYNDIESRVQAVILNHLGLPPMTREEIEIVKEVDDLILGHEANHIMENTDGWGDRYINSPTHIFLSFGMRPQDSKSLFLALFKHYTKILKVS